MNVPDVAVGGRLSITPLVEQALKMPSTEGSSLGRPSAGMPKFPCYELGDAIVSHLDGKDCSTLIALHPAFRRNEAMYAKALMYRTTFIAKRPYQRRLQLYRAVATAGERLSEASVVNLIPALHCTARAAEDTLDASEKRWIYVSSSV